MFKRPLCLIASAFVAAVFVFLLFYPPDYSDPGKENGEVITVSGKVTSKETGTDFDGNQVQVLYIKDSGKDDTIVKVYLSSSYQSNFETIPQIGEQVDVQGEYYAFNRASNPGEFDSRKYYKILKIEYQVRDGSVQYRDLNANSFKESLYRIRMYLSGILDQTFNEEDASVMKAMLLGDRTSMDEEIKGLYQGAGIIHILSISGLHISILGMGLYKLLRKCRIPIIPASVVAISLMLSYGVMCGMGTSAIRAIIMFSLHMIATVIGRSYDMLTGIAVAAMLLIIEQPLYIYHSGFLMSFGAVIGIGLVLPTMQVVRTTEYKKRMDKLIRDGKKLELGDYLAIAREKVTESAFSIVKASLSVSSVCLPVQMNTYYTFPVYSVFLNILVLPFMTILIGLGIIVLISGSVMIELTLIPGLLCHVILAMYKSICIGSRLLPWNTWYAGHADTWQVVVYYILLIVFVLLYKYINGKYHIRDNECDIVAKEDVIAKEDNTAIRDKMRIKAGIVECKYLIPIYIIPIIAVVILSIRIRPDLRMAFLHVGQGDGIVIEAGDMTFLVDGGSTSKNSVGQYILTPYLKYEGIGYIDACIITHEDKDHISGVMELLEAMPNGGIQIGNLILPDCSEDSREDSYKELEEAALNAGVPVSYIKRGDTLSTGNNDISIECLGPVEGLKTDGANAHSTILFIRYGDFKSLLTGDVEEEGLSSLNEYLEQNQNTYSNITLLKVPHHGSRYTTDERFLDLLNPACAVISAGRNNMYGHPHDEVLERLENVESDYYITYETGAVTVDCDGDYSKLSVFLPQ